MQRSVLTPRFLSGKLDVGLVGFEGNIFRTNIVYTMLV